MKLFVVGGSGYIGAGAVAAFAADGAEITALSRSQASDAVLRQAGATPVRGAISDIAVLLEAAGQADCVLWAAAFDPAELPVLTALATSLAARRATFIYTCGTAVVARLTMGEPDDTMVAENDAFTPPRFMEVRVRAEQIVLAAAGAGARAMVVRPPLVYGHGGSSHIPALFESGRRSGAVRYVGRGLNQWSYVHLDDLSRLFVAAWSHGHAGAIYHSTAGEVTMRDLAEAAAACAVMPAASWSVAEAEAETGYGKFMARIVIGCSSRTSSALTQQALGWSPRRHDILRDVAAGSYQTKYAPQSALNP